MRDRGGDSGCRLAALSDCPDERLDPGGRCLIVLPVSDYQQADEGEHRCDDEKPENGVRDMAVQREVHDYFW